ncbi:MAG: phosphoenolpyruvate-utilizing N-terminal domain-containing protein, partial [Geminicoccales bacterium]
MSDAGGVVLSGIVASPGLAIGPIALQQGQRIAPRKVGSPDEERDALRAAMAAAAAQLTALSDAAQDDVASGILEFQLALLDDEDLTLPILEATARRPAHEAWARAIDREIAAYEAGDETLRARAADLADLQGRVMRALAPAAEAPSGIDRPAAIYVAEELTPSRFLEIDWSRHVGAAIRGGSVAGHVALLARARGTPLIVGLEGAFTALRDGALAVLDAEQGRLILDPTPETLAKARQRLDGRAAQAKASARFLGKPAMTADGERVHVYVNVDDPALLDG